MASRSKPKSVLDEALEDDTTEGADPDPDPDTSDATDVSDADDDADSAEVPTAEPTTRRRVVRRLLIAVAGIVVVAVLGAVGYGGWQYRQLVETADAGRAALSTARDYAVTITSVDSKDIDGNTARVLDGATGEFKDMYSRSAAQLRQVLVDNDAGAQGTVLAAGITSATRTKVDVLLFVDQSVTNKANPQPRLDRNRVAMTMELVDDRWLAAKVDVF